MPYRMADDFTSADLAFVAQGETLGAAFACAAEAVVEIMLEDPRTLRREEEREVTRHNPQLDLLLHDFLSELLYIKDAESLLLMPESVEVRESSEGFELISRLSGERIDRVRHLFRTDVKAVTMHRLSVERTASGWEATVVLDV